MRRWFSILLVTATCLVALILILISPFALTGVEGLSRNWAKLSNVGQSYGAISALIGSLALVGVVTSLLYQARAGQTAREQSIRSLQQDLIRMEMEDPSLMTAIGAPWGLPIPAESAKIREYLYIHMWASFWAGNYAVGEVSAQAVRGMARSELLNSKAGRAYWAAVRENVLNTNEGKYRSFARIVDKEYQSILASNAPVAEPVKVTNATANPKTNPNTEFRLLALLCVALLMMDALVWRKIIQKIIRME